MGTKIRAGQIVCMLVAAAIIFPIGHQLTFNTFWSYSEPLTLLATGIEGALSAAIGLLAYKMIFRTKT
jgi:hypothetical protein